MAYAIMNRQLTCSERTQALKTTSSDRELAVFRGNLGPPIRLQSSSTIIGYGWNTMTGLRGRTRRQERKHRSGLSGRARCATWPYYDVVCLFVDILLHIALHLLHLAQPSTPATAFYIPSYKVVHDSFLLPASSSLSTSARITR